MNLKKYSLNSSEKYTWLGVNFINILWVCFSYESKFQSFSLIIFGFVIFGAKILYENIDEIEARTPLQI